MFLYIALFLPCKMWCQTCIDSLETISYASPLFFFNANGFKTALTADASTLIGLPYFSSGSQNFLLYKIATSGKVIWAKKISEHEPDGFVVGSIKEMKDQSIAITLQTSDKSIIILTDNSGKILWQKEYDAGIDYGFLYNIKINVDDNNIYVESLINKNISISCIDNTGKVIWNNLYSLQQNGSLAIDISGIHIKDGIVYALGTLNYTTFNHADSVGVWLLKLNSKNGKILYTQSYLFNNALQNADSIISLLPGESFFAEQKNQLIYYAQFFLGNEAIVRFDTALNPVNNAIEINTEKSIPELSRSLICNKNGFISYYQSQSEPDTYYSIIDTQNNFIAQKKITYQGRLYGHASINLLLDNTIYATISSTDTQNKLAFNISRIPTGFINSILCNEEDGVFAYTTPLLVKKTHLSWNDVSPLFIQPQTLTFNEYNFSVSDSLLCKQLSSCDKLKITGKNAFCSTDSIAEFTALKNQACIKNVTWSCKSDAVTFLQSDNDTLLVHFNHSWKGFIHANINGCGIGDSLFINITQPNQVKIGNDTTLCKNSNLILHAGKYFLSYKWQDSSTDSNFVVSNPGKYYVSVIDSCNRQSSDTINVNYSNAQLLDSHNPVSICKGFDTVLSANTGFSNYEWHSFDLTNYSNQRNIAINESKNNMYTVSAFAFPECLVKDSLEVIVKNCPANIYFPSAFTPNGDGINDVFRPVTKERFMYFDLAIFNRLGQRVFHTNTSQTAWDGKVRNIPQPMQTLVWRCKYQFYNSQPIISKGTVVLIR